MEHDGSQWHRLNPPKSGSQVSEAQFVWKQDRAEPVKVNASAACYLLQVARTSGDFA
jgi:hypothetical protein